jgi:hypothetical protein
MAGKKAGKKQGSKENKAEPSAFEKNKFKKGQSGNPKGYTKGKKNRSTILKELLALVVLDENGKPKANPLKPSDKKITYEQMVGIALVKKATEDGDVRAIQEILDTMHGKIKDEGDLTLKGAIEHVETKRLDLSKITSDELKKLDKIVSKAVTKTDK